MLKGQWKISLILWHNRLRNTADRLADFGYKTEAEREAEFINDFIGSQFGEAAFWKMLQARNASLFHRVATLAWEFLKELGGRIAGMPRDVRPYFQDIEAARNAVAEAIEAYLLTGEFPDRVLDDSADADLARSNIGSGVRKEAKGGPHGKVKGVDDNESHHMPADSVSPIPREKGPAISMKKRDHRLTASCGSSREAKAYRKQQKDLIDEGKFLNAQQMDIEDVRSKFGDKYDRLIQEMLDYTKTLIQEQEEQ